MQYSQYDGKVAKSFGFSTLHNMDRSNFDMDVCWAKNGFTHDKAIQLFSAIAFADTKGRDSDELLYYMCATQEGAKKLISYGKSFGQIEHLANALIRGLDYRLQIADDQGCQLKIDRVVRVICDLVHGENIPYSAFHKTDYITNLEYWKAITQSCQGIHEVLNRIDAPGLSAARYFIESQIGAIAGPEVMKKWNYPGYFHTGMSHVQRLFVYEKIAECIGDRQALINLASPGDFDKRVTLFHHTIGKSKSLDQWKGIFRINDIFEYFSTIPDQPTPCLIYDVIASSISASDPDFEKLKELNVNVRARMIIRGNVDDHTALAIAGKNPRLKGLVLEDALGI